MEADLVRTQIQLTEQQSILLKRIASDKRLSVAELICRSIDLYLNVQTEPSPDERERQLLSIVGIGNSGLSDLAEKHDAYLVEAYAGLERPSTRPEWSC